MEKKRVVIQTDEAHLFVRGRKEFRHGRSERSVQDEAGPRVGRNELVRDQVGKDPAWSVGAVHGAHAAPSAVIVVARRVEGEK